MQGGLSSCDEDTICICILFSPFWLDSPSLFPVLFYFNF